MLKRIHVYDLDGVLVDTSHRYRNKSDGTIDLKYWLKNRTPDGIARDTLLPLARQYMADCFNPEIYVIICTSREYHALDIGYIVGYLGAPNKLIMRPVGNTEADAILKRRQLQRMFNLRQFSKLPRRFWEDSLTNLYTCRDLFSEVFHVASKITGRI